MAKRLLYLFGAPGTGKITVARILQERLGWKLFWLHDLDGVCKIVGRYPLPRLMDTVSEAVLREMMESGEDIIYVRPSRDLKTILGVLDLAKAQGYTTSLVRLWADDHTLIGRVSGREKSEFRISDADGLFRYFYERPSTEINQGEIVIDTANRTPEQVAEVILGLLLPTRATLYSPGKITEEPIYGALNTLSTGG